VVKNIPNSTNGAGEAYHGFWTLDAESINDNMGTEQDLLDLSQALHDRGMVRINSENTQEPLLKLTCSMPVLDGRRSVE